MAAMARTTQTKSTKTKAHSKAYKKPHGKLALAGGFLVSLSAATILAFISLEMGFTALAFLAISSVLYYENTRRNFWEQAASFKFKQIKDEQKRFARDLTFQRFDLNNIRDEVDELAGRPLDIEQELLIEKETMLKRKKLATRPVRSAQRSPASDAPLRARQPVSGPSLSASPSAPTKKDPPLTSPANYDPHADYDALSDMVVKELVHNAVQNDQVDVFLQPIMRLPQRQTRFFEIFARIRAKPGMYLPASRYISLARKDHLMNKVDHLLLMQCLETVKNTAHMDEAAPFFINITTSTLSSSLFMTQLLGFLSKNRDLAPRLVFEIQQDEFDAMEPAILEILRGLGRLGCSLSIDHVTNLDFDIKFLQVLKVRYVKINASELLANTGNDKAFTEMNRFKKRLEGNGIGFVVEKIENEKTLKELLDFDIRYGQGYLFGRPDLEGAYKDKLRIA